MKFNYSPAPNYRSKLSTKRIMFELLMGLLVVYAFSLYYYATADNFGMPYVMQALVIMASAVGGCVGTEIVWALVTKQNVVKFLSGSFGWITGVILALMMPIDTSWYAVLVSAILCILFAKLVFGGFGQNIFNPAAVGRAIIFAAFTGGAFKIADLATGVTPTTLIASDYAWCVTDSALVTEMLDKVGGLGNLALGFYPGALGETSALLIAIVGVVLALRKVIDWRVPVVYVGGVFVLTSFMALYKGMGMWYPFVHILTGGVMFGAVFMATDPVTTPTSAAGRVIYAFGCAILTVLIRVSANLPEGVLYSILIMNAFTPMIERVCDCEQIHGLKNSIITFAAVAVFGVGSTVLAIHATEPAVKEEPVVPEAKVIDSTNADFEKFKSEVTGSKENGDGSVTYSVKTEGYAVYNYSDGVPNEFEITVKDGAVREVVVTKAADTPYVGDQIAEESFTSKLVGLTLDDLKVEAISGSTISSASALKAVETALSAE